MDTEEFAVVLLLLTFISLWSTLGFFPALFSMGITGLLIKAFL